MDHSPDGVDVHCRVAVHQDVTESYNRAQVRYLALEGLVAPGQLPQGFADDLELALHG